jgi:hypothetical protein
VIVRAAVVPHPPLLVPEIAAGTDGDVIALREACLSVAPRLTSAAPRWVAVGTFTGFGADVSPCTSYHLTCCRKTVTRSANIWPRTRRRWTANYHLAVLDPIT